MKRTSSIAAVLATREAKNKLPNVEMAALKCNHCSNTFAVQAGLAAPFCVSCGSGDLKRVQTSSKMQILAKVKDDDLLGVVCASCNVHNIMHIATARTLDGRMNCVNCGTAVSFPVDADGDEGEEENAFMTGTGPESSDKHMPESYTDDDEELSSVDDDEDADEDDSEEDSDVEYGDDDDADEDDEDTEAGVDWDEPTANPTPIVCSDEDDEDGDDDADEESDFGGDGIGDDDALEDETEDDGNMEAVALLYTVPRKARVRFVQVSPKSVVAFANGVSVGTLHSKTETASVFGNDAFMKSLEVSVAQSGLKATLSKYGFALTKVKFDRKRGIAEAAAELAAVERKKVEASFNRDLKVFRQCMSIASSGMNRDVFRDQGNPLKEALFEALSGLGVRNPTKVIQRAFSDAGDEYHKALIQVASGLMLKPKDVRDQLAKSLCEMKPVIDEDSDDVVSNDGDGDEDDLLENSEESGFDDDEDIDDEDDSEENSGLDEDEEDDMEDESSFEVRSSLERRLSTPIVATRQRKREQASVQGRRPLFARRGT